ncbi:MAG: inositol-1-monophosphatase [Bacteroides sp. SM23_62_1]|nr:MAG: inositol-1-monophosphatase [Bacteroides sp. SM23_62_1]
MDLENLCVQAQVLVIETGEFILNEQSRFSALNIESKGIHNYVTYVDKNSEERLVRGLKMLLPEAGIIAEEGTGIQKGDRYHWIIDPLDGTTNFIHGLPPYAISIALMDKDEIVLGIVYEITFRECFYAWKNSKAYLNGREVRVSTTDKVSKSLIATGFPYINFEKIDPFLFSLKYFMEHSHGVRRLGSAATDMAYVACGRFDAFYEYGLNPWDVAAAVLIIQQAGGKICDFNGGNNWLWGKEIITSNAYIYDEFKDIVTDIMVKEIKR